MDKYWCEHIYWNENETGCGYGGPQKTWILRYPRKGHSYLDSFHNTPLCELAQFCPICGTPRPSEKKVELPEKFEFETTLKEYPLSNSENLAIAFNKLIDYLRSRESNEAK